MKIMTLILSCLLVSAITSATVYADDRPATPEERAALEKVMSQQGCTGGKFEFDTDDNKFEVENAVCADGKRYDFDLDISYNIIKKELDS